jgi:hypothetical protein
MASMEDGRKIEWNDEQFSNAYSPKAQFLESGSNITVERPWQLLKQRSEMVSTDPGMQIDCSDKQ